MANDIDKELSQKYCPRFAQIAASKGFVSSEQVKLALSEQVEDDLSSKEHRLIGSIFLEKGWMTPHQIETVLNELFQQSK